MQETILCCLIDFKLIFEIVFLTAFQCQLCSIAWLYFNIFKVNLLLFIDSCAVDNSVQQTSTRLLIRLMKTKSCQWKMKRRVKFVQVSGWSFRLVILLYSSLLFQYCVFMRLVLKLIDYLIYCQIIVLSLPQENEER